MRLHRRQWLLLGASGLPALASATGPSSGRAVWDPVTPQPAMQFPIDHGAHPGHRTEWWYVTGWLQRANAPDIGFQITFFRSRTAHPAENPSRFAPHQLILAHAALALPERARLLHAERAARAGFDRAGAQTGDTRVWIGTGPARWSMTRDPATDRYQARISDASLAIDLALTPSGAPLLQGESGFSRKGPLPQQASRYYSRPHLQVGGSIRAGDGAPNVQVSGNAWFDHEWSSEILASDAVGWDWTGINLDDGGALMAFRIRDRQGNEVWRNAMLRTGAQGRPITNLQPVFQPLRHWRSTRSGANWPVAMQVQLGSRRLELQPLFDDQELDARGSTGTPYWEGAVTALENGRRVGRGYLELTGYAGAMRL